LRKSCRIGQACKRLLFVVTGHYAWDSRLYSRPDCVACPIKYVCGGGCRLDSLERHANSHKPDPVGCFFRRRMFEEALWFLCELGPEKMATVVPNPREMRRQMFRRKLPRKAGTR